jgi:hypothetical protein
VTGKHIWIKTTSTNPSVIVQEICRKCRIRRRRFRVGVDRTHAGHTITEFLEKKQWKEVKTPPCKGKTA